MHPDGAFVADLQRALDAVGLEAIVIGSVAAALQGAPVMTLDVDLLVRDTPGNRHKLIRLEQHLSARLTPVSELATTQRLSGLSVPVDILFDGVAGGFSFEAIRSRSGHVDLAGASIRVASLADIIASKEAAGRPKDMAHLPILRDTLRVRTALAAAEAASSKHGDD